MASLGALGDVPRDMLEAIIKMADPPTTYRLCLTSKGFHVPADAQSTSTPGKLCRLSTRLLQLSLKNSLERVLVSKNTSLAAFDFSAMRSDDGPGAVLTGSTVVLACLGREKFSCGTSDVDIYTSPACAAAVRSKLVTSGTSIPYILYSIVATLHRRCCDQGPR